MDDSSITPADLAAIDQHRADAAVMVTGYVTAFREHADLHGGDPICAQAGTIAALLSGCTPIQIADIAASAICRLAQAQR